MQSRPKDALSISFECFKLNVSELCNLGNPTNEGIRMGEVVVVPILE